MDLADAKICKTLIINIVYFADSLNSYLLTCHTGFILKKYPVIKKNNGM